jgi:hypothetical protein
MDDGWIENDLYNNLNGGNEEVDHSLLQGWKGGQ